MSFDSKLPHTPTIPVEPFVPHLPDEALQDLRDRLVHAAPRRRTWDNTRGQWHLGVKHAWLSSTIERWIAFDWRGVEAEIAAIPSYYATVEHKGHTYKIHFLALWSTRADAKPIVFSHGWPGSVLEFIPMINYIKATYTPDTLPNHVIVPGLVGYGFSSPPAEDLEFTSRDCAEIFDAVLVGLGFGRNAGGGGGYYAQGGDIGSFVSRQLTRSPNCVGLHVNFFPLVQKPDGAADPATLDEYDTGALERGNEWLQWMQGYRVEHSTKPATIGAVLESSPVALLAWIGEKRDWMHHPDRPHIDRWLLSNVSLYWLTNCAASCLWEYRAAYGRERLESSHYPAYIDKPTGYSHFPFEIRGSPIEWVKVVANVVHAKRHDQGGHFAALEEPETLWADVQEYVRAVEGAPVV